MKKSIQRERFNRTADAIEANPEQFDYSSWGDLVDGEGNHERSLIFGNQIKDVIDSGVLKCGFVGCIGGWAAHTAIQDEDFQPKHPWSAYSIAALGSEYLGLRPFEAHDLFLGDAMKTAGLYPQEMDSDELLETATGADAAKLLRMVADGEVMLSDSDPGFDFTDYEPDEEVKHVDSDD